MTTLVRTCERTYNDQRLLDAGIRVYVGRGGTSQDLEFADGAPPAKSIITTWLKIVRETFSKRKSLPDKPAAPKRMSKAAAAKYDPGLPTIAIHCVAGLGRAPVLVAIALVEQGMDSLRAMDEVREARKNAMNNAQVEFLMKYKRKKEPSCCSIF